jgi:hypothetical protein
MKLSFVPKEKNEMLLGAAMLPHYWAEPMTSPWRSQQLQSSLQDTILHLNQLIQRRPSIPSAADLLIFT